MEPASGPNGPPPGPDGRDPEPDDEGHDLLRELYRAVLRLYPRGFRSRFGSDLLQAFDDRRGERRFTGIVGGLRLVLFLTKDVVLSVPRTRRDTDEPRGWETMMSNLVSDVVFAGRMLLKSPVFTVAAVLTLALGIGLNTAAFSAVHAFLLRPLEGAEEPGELVQIYRSWAGIEFGANSIPHYRDLRDRSGEAFEDVAAWAYAPMALSADGRTERTMGVVASADFFRTYGVAAALGRTFVSGEEDRAPGAHPVVVLGHGYWQSRFGGDPQVVGRTVTLNGHAFEILGVLPPDFRGPVNYADIPLYVPLMMQREVMPGGDLIEARGSNSFSVVGRLREGATVERARQVMDGVLAQLRDELPDDYENQIGHRLVLQEEAGIHPMFAEATVGMSAVMMTVVGLLLLMACVNVANLFLARARDRQREMGLRLSLGAPRRRIVQQLLTESVLFSLLAGAAGLGLAVLATRALAVFQPPVDGPWHFEIGVDGTALWFTAGVSVAAGLVFGMVPALHSARSDPMGALKANADRKAFGSRTSSLLVVLQVALSLVLLVGSGLFLRSLQGATRIDPGFDDPAHVALASVDPGLQGHDEVRSRQVLDRMLEEVRALPGVTAAGLVDYPPLGLNSSQRGVGIPGYEFAEGEQNSLGYVRASEGYLEAMGTELLEGRTLRRTDDDAGAPVIVVNRRFAERFWPEESAVGKVVSTAGAEREVVGVVETGKYQSLGETPREFMILPHRQVFASGMTVVARTAGEPGPVLGRVREIVRGIDPDMPVFDVRTMAEHMGTALLPARLGGILLGLFGVLGLTLAAVGIYGVMAYSVARRGRELGIRIALGAGRGEVVGMVLREGLRLALVGTVLGLIAAALAARGVQGLLYDVEALDPVAFIGVPLMLVAIAALAVYLPARRASRADPMWALKTE